MLPAVLLSVSIAVPVLRVEPQIITFVMLAMMPCAIVWWTVGWQSAAVYLSGYLAVRAFRGVWARPRHLPLE